MEQKLTRLVWSWSSGRSNHLIDSSLAAVLVAAVVLLPHRASAMSACGYAPPPASSGPCKIVYCVNASVGWGERNKPTGASCSEGDGAFYGTCTSAGRCLLGSMTLIQKYLITSVYYAPPGANSSVVYQSGNSRSVNSGFSTTTSNASSYQYNGVYSAFIVGGNTVNETSSLSTSGSASLTQTVAANNSIVVPCGGRDGPAFCTDYVDHSGDSIEFLTNVALDVSEYYGYDTYAYNLTPTSTTNSGPYQVEIGWINHQRPDYGGTVSWLKSAWGFTDADLATIAGADPYSAANPPSGPLDVDGHRYCYKGSIQYGFCPVGTIQATQGYSTQVTNQSATTLGGTWSSAYGYSTGFNVSYYVGLDGVGGLTTSVTTTNTSSWDNSSVTSTSSLTSIGCPSSAYVPPPLQNGHLIQVYEDVIYKTVMYVDSAFPKSGVPRCDCIGSSCTVP